jgi:ribosomal protein L29
MSIFKEASQLKLRFQTTKGALATEQIWDLTLTELSALLKNLKKAISKSSSDESLAFLDESFEVDKEAELRFNVAKEIYLYKKDEHNAAINAASNKEHDQYILRLIAEKEKEDLKGKSVEELQALLKGKH